MSTQQKLAAITIIGGTDAPGIQIVPDGHGGYKIKRIPGWNPEQLADLAGSLRIVSAASRLHTVGLAEAAIASVGKFVEGQLGEHAGGGNVVVVMAG